MSNFKVEFTLKQHTPIIHFQSDQSGATLRASELKPKFDKFLMQHAFEVSISKKFKISDIHNALKYKVYLKTISSNKQLHSFKTYISKRDKENPNFKVGSYFGDNKTITHADSIEVIFIVFNPTLLQKIKDYFVDFINITNFGTRQNKGFGSFSVIKMNNEIIQNDIESSLLKYYPSVYKSYGKEPLSKIMSDYQKLKSGTPSPNYSKSLLFEYMCNDQKRWEKRMIKEYMKKDYPHVFSVLKYEKPPVECMNEAHYDYEYIRGLLGIADHIDFLKFNPTNFKDKITILIEPVDKKIDRFKSPLTFKVFDNTIYVLATNDIPIKGKKFNFSIKGQKGILNDSIAIPNEFDIFKFLNYALSKLNYTMIVGNK